MINRTVGQMPPFFSENWTKSVPN